MDQIIAVNFQWKGPFLQTAPTASGTNFVKGYFKIRPLAFVTKKSKTTKFGHDTQTAYYNIVDINMLILTNDGGSEAS